MPIIPAEAGRSGVQDQPQIHSEFEATLGYGEPIKKRKKDTNEINKTNLTYKNSNNGAGAMARQLRGWAAYPEDQGSSPSTYMAFLSVTPIPGNPAPFSGPCGYPACMGTELHACNPPMYTTIAIIQNNFS